MSDKVQFQTNVPIDVALKYNDGKEVTGQYGDQVLYTLTDGRVMYVPPIVKKKIDELGIGRGELFTITKAEKKNGTRRTIEWVVGTDGSGDRKPQRRDQQPNGTAPAQRRGGAGSAPANTTSEPTIGAASSAQTAFNESPLPAGNFRLPSAGSFQLAPKSSDQLTSAPQCVLKFPTRIRGAFLSGRYAAE